MSPPQQLSAGAVQSRPVTRRALNERSVSGELLRTRSGVTEPVQRELRQRDPRQFDDAFLGYPVQSAQMADLLEAFAQLCSAGWTAPDALRNVARGARPEIRAVAEEAAVRASGGMALSEALAPFSSSLSPLVAPAIRAWERNGQRDEDLRTLTREMRRIGELEQRNTVFQIRSFMERNARRERQAMRVPGTRLAERSVNGTRGGMARRSRATMRWTDLFVSMWRCNVPISEALEAAGDGCGNNYYRHVLTLAAQRTREGVPLSECLAETRLLPLGLIDRLRTGELSGRLDETLEEFSRVLEGDAKELGGQSLFMRVILPAILVMSALTVFAFGTIMGNPVIGLIGALVFLPVAFVLWELIFRTSVAGAPNLGIGNRERGEAAEKERR